MEQKLVGIDKLLADVESKLKKVSHERQMYEELISIISNDSII